MMMIHITIPTTQPTTTPKTLEEPPSSLVCAPLATLDDTVGVMVDLETEVVKINDATLLS